MYFNLAESKAAELGLVHGDSRYVEKGKPLYQPLSNEPYLEYRNKSLLGEVKPHVPLQFSSQLFVGVIDTKSITNYIYREKSENKVDTICDAIRKALETADHKK